MGRKETREERNLRLRETNRLLKEAGVPSSDRQRLRNASPETIAKILETGKVPAKGEKISRQEPTRPEPAIPIKGKSETKDQRADRLRENYKRLRKAGLSSKDASRLRNASQDTIQKVIATKEVPPLKHKYTRRDKKVFPLSWKPAAINYTNRYSVVVAVFYVRPGPKYRTDYVTIQADFELTADDVDSAVWNIVEQTANDPQGGSDWAYVGHRIVACYIKEDIPESPRPERFRKYDKR